MNANLTNLHGLHQRYLKRRGKNADNIEPWLRA